METPPQSPQRRQAPGMRTPPQSPRPRQAPGAPRPQRQGMRTPPRRRRRGVPGAPQRTRRSREDGEEENNRKRQEDFEEALAIAAGTRAPKPGLLRNNEPERDTGYQPPSMIEFILGRNRRQRRQDEGPDDNKRPDDETPDANPQTDGLIVNNLKF